mmetsp:Transcript_17076/g.23468  ORF Transcript_17076/g.23468 Transcript_17076/m.23468 type:complete len:534 (-) Transcript_17076:124-1725(-)
MTAQTWTMTLVEMEALQSPSVVSSAAFWIARKGPLELVNAALSLLYRLMDGNPQIGQQLSNLIIKVTAARQGINIPENVMVPQLRFGWKIAVGDERRDITLISLLSESYIFNGSCVGGCWNPEAALFLKDSLNVDFDVLSALLSGEPDCFAKSCLCVLEKLLSTDDTASDMLIQFVLAPPPPPSLGDGDDSFDFGASGTEASQPLGTGTMMLKLVLEGGNKILNCNQFSSVTVNAFRNDLELAERAANVLAVVFTNSSLLARDLSTTISTSHISSTLILNRMKSGGVNSENKLLLTFLMLSAERTTRMPQGSGYSLLVAILRLLSTMVCGCERATKLVLEDPANLFVLVLATAESESAGVPPIAQTVSCLFLGCCFLALKDAAAEEASGDPSNVSGGLINKRMFISMIDSRIGFSRFTDLLKKPLISANSSLYVDFFISSGFRIFYEKQLESIRNGIIEFYAGGSSNTANSAQQQVIEMQQQKIAELEKAVALAISERGTQLQNAPSNINGEHVVELTRLKSSIESSRRETLN